MNSPSLSLYTGVPTLLRSRARPTEHYPHSPTLSTCISAIQQSEATGNYYYNPERPHDMLQDSASIRSSPSLYSRPASHVGHGQPTAYSHQTMHRQREYEESECGSDVGADTLEVSHTQNRISMVSGPRVTKYADIPWEEFGEQDLASFSGSGNIGRMLRAATGRATGNSTLSTASTIRSGPDSPTLTGDASRKGLGIFGGRGKNMLSSSSGVSLASTQTVSTASSDERTQPVTPRFKGEQRGHTSGPRVDRVDSLGGQADDVPVFGSNRREAMFGDMKKMDNILDPSPIPQHRSPRNLRPTASGPDRPLLSSGSPGFGLISLEVAQERERQKANRRTGVDALHSSIRSPLSDKTNVGNGTNDGPPVPPRGVKQKKSLMRLLKGDKSNPAFHLVTPALPSVPKLPSSAGITTGEGSLRAGGSVWSDTSESHTSAVWPPRQPSPSPAKRGQNQIHPPGAGMLGAELVRPRLELRPISMNFSNALPPSLLSDPTSSPPPPVPPLPSSNETDKIVAEAVKEQIANMRKGWMVQLFELEAQVRELKDELEEARTVRPGACETCGCMCGNDGTGGRTKLGTSASASLGAGTGDWLKPGSGSVMDRGRAKTGGARGVFGSGSLYEWE